MGPSKERGHYGPLYSQRELNKIVHTKWLVSLRKVANRKCAR